MSVGSNSAGPAGGGGGLAVEEGPAAGSSSGSFTSVPVESLQTAASAAPVSAVSAGEAATAGLSDELLIQSRLPTTVVDVSASTVQRTNQDNEYVVLREEYLENELLRLSDVRMFVSAGGGLDSDDDGGGYMGAGATAGAAGGAAGAASSEFGGDGGSSVSGFGGSVADMSALGIGAAGAAPGAGGGGGLSVGGAGSVMGRLSGQKMPVWTAPNGLFHSVKDNSPMVRDLLADVARVYPHRLRRPLIEQFVEELLRRATTLVRCVEAELALGPPLQEPATKRIKNDLDLTADGDFKIVLSRAEALRPGISTDLLGDPRSVELALKSLMENF